MMLSTWIKKQGGTGAVGKLLNVERNCVYAWLHGTSIPRPITMQQVVKKSRGAVSYDDMIEEYKVNMAKKAKQATYKKPVSQVKPSKTPKPKKKKTSSPW